MNIKLFRISNFLESFRFESNKLPIAIRNRYNFLKQLSSQKNMSVSSQQSFQQELTDDTPTEQKIVDQLHQSQKDTHRTMYNTPTKPSVLKENQAEINSQDIQTNDEIPPLVNFLSCYVSLTRYQEDNDINIPIVNIPEDLDLELQQSQKDNELLSLYDVDSYLEHKIQTNTMIIIDVP
ncbi:unnamed protein product [Rotaria socialis]|uniref:Uncharacterized protein n=1 Tax=Rotaria socialis TaxID=392032 RepID=A0A821EN28_9BILA|nr:unnamed protein product [Rotaria socialis]